MRPGHLTMLAATVLGCGTSNQAIDASAPTADALDISTGPFALVVDRPAGGGRVHDAHDVIDCNARCTAQVARGVVDLTAEPDPGSAFIGWTGACASQSTATCHLSIGSDVTVGARFSSCPSHVRWARSFGGPGDDGAAALASDATSVVVAGWFTGTMDPGAGSISAVGATDVFVARYSASGVPAWNVAFGGADRDEATGVALLPSGDVIVVGRFEGMLRVGTTVLASRGAFDAFVLELDGATGAPRWAVSFGAGDRDEALAVATDGTGEIAVAGGFSRNVAFGSFAMSSHIDAACNASTCGWEDAFVAKLSAATGDVIWARRGGGRGRDLAQAIAFDRLGGVVATGIVYPASAEIDSVAFVGHGDGGLGGAFYDGFAVRYDTTGLQSWVTELGGTELDDVRAVGVATDGTILVGGTKDFLATSSDGFRSDATNFIARLGSTGAIESLAGPGGAGSDAILRAILDDGVGGVWIAGGFDNSFDLGTPGVLHNTVTQDPVSPDRSYDMSLLHLDATGAATRAIRIGGYGRDQLRALAPAPGGGVFAAGELAATVDLCPTVATSAGGEDVVVMAIGPEAGTTATTIALTPPPAPSPPSGPSSCIAPPPVTAPPAPGSPPSFAEADWGGGSIADLAGAFAVGDVDGDGHDDLIIASSIDVDRPGLVIYRNDGTGHFSEDTSNVLAAHHLDLQGPGGLLLFDANGDGRTDVLAGAPGRDQWPFPGGQMHLLEQTNGVLTDRTYAVLPIDEEACEHVLAADLDCDGDLDLWAPGHSPQQVLLNQDSGHFAVADRLIALPGRPIAGNGAAFCDVNRDGAPDLLYVGQGSANALFLNDGLGQLFMQPATVLPAAPFGTNPTQDTNRVACVDYDRDGWPDFVMLAELYDGTGETMVVLWHNRGDGTFEDRSTEFPTVLPSGELAVADLNGDGWPDVIVSRSVNQPEEARVFINQGGTFAAIPGLAPADTGASVIVPIDADGDGRVDLLRLRLGTSTASSVLFNRTP